MPRVVLFKGNDRSFCAGGDVASIARALLNPSLDQSIVKDFFSYEYLADNTM